MLILGSIWPTSTVSELPKQPQECHMASSSAHTHFSLSLSEEHQTSSPRLLDFHRTPTLAGIYPSPMKLEAQSQPTGTTSA